MQCLPQNREHKVYCMDDVQNQGVVCTWLIFPAVGVDVMELSRPSE